MSQFLSQKNKILNISFENYCLYQAETLDMYCAMNTVKVHGKVNYVISGKEEIININF